MFRDEVLPFLMSTPVFPPMLSPPSRPEMSEPVHMGFRACKCLLQPAISPVTSVDFDNAVVSSNSSFSIFRQISSTVIKFFDRSPSGNVIRVAFLPSFFGQFATVYFSGLESVIVAYLPSRFHQLWNLVEKDHFR